MKTLVIGGGYLGLATAFLLAERGHAVSILDDGDPRSGSRASGHLWRREWFETKTFRDTCPDWWTRQHLEESKEWLADLDRENFVLTGEVEKANDFATIDRYTQFEDLLRLSDFYQTFAFEINFVRGEAESVNEVDGVIRVRYDGGKTFDVDRLVIAAGYRNWALTEALRILSPMNPPEIVRGRSWLFDTYNGPDAAHQTFPVPLNAVRVYPNLVRIGDSFENRDDPSGQRARTAALEMAQDFYDSNIKAPEKEVDGFREIGPRGKAYVLDIPDRNIWVIGGAGKVGLGLAGGIAFEVAERIGRNSDEIPVESSANSPTPEVL